MIDVPERVAYTQLAEECTELAHAALKLGRKADPEQCFAMAEGDKQMWLDNLNEEIADVLVCMDVVIMKYQGKGALDKIGEIRKQKLERWEERLKR